MKSLFTVMMIYLLFKKFHLEVGETLKLLIGNEPVVVVSSIKRKRYNYTYGTSYHNECITGQADVDCFEEVIESIPTTPVGSFTLESNCITPNINAVIIYWDILCPMCIEVQDIDPNELYCLKPNTCFYILYEDGTSTETYCI